MKESKEAFDAIRRASEEIEVPKELRPEAVERMLRERAQEREAARAEAAGAEKSGGAQTNGGAAGAQTLRPEGGGRRSGEVRRRVRLFAGAAAAAAVLAAAVGLGMTGRVPAEPEHAASAGEAPVPGEAGGPWKEGAAGAETEGKGAAEEEAEEIPQTEAIARAQSYEEIYERLIFEREEAYCETSKEGAAADGAVMEGAAAGAAGGMAVQEELRQPQEKSADYSKTNVREAGVDEADVVKTDGTYIYTAAAFSDRVQVIRASDLSLQAEVLLSGIGQIREIYVENGRLTVLSGSGETAIAEDGAGLFSTEYVRQTKAEVYDIRDPERPRKLGEIVQEGDYHTSRKVGDYLYLFTDCWKEQGQAGREESYIPAVNGKLLESSAIYLPHRESPGHYVVISSVNLNRPDRVEDAKAVLCDGGQYYISAGHMYLAQTEWGGGAASEETQIYKFRFSDGNIWAKAAGLVPGSLMDSFCIDEYDGMLRLVTNRWQEGEMVSGLYVLDESLELLGRIEDIAPGENLQSARFMGEMGYFVTFRQVDPLFAADLSDPENPKLLGELKVSGYSAYLHPYGEGRLLGLGVEADEASGQQTGYKLSMFDVSKPSEMEELDKVVFEDVFMAGLYNYRSVLADPQKNVIGVCLERWDGEAQSVNYRVYSYGEEGFEKLLDYPVRADRRIDVEKIRGLYIGDTFYVVSPAGIAAFDMNGDYAQTGEHVLSK